MKRILIIAALLLCLTTKTDAQKGSSSKPSTPTPTKSFSGGSTRPSTPPPVKQAAPPPVKQATPTKSFSGGSTTPQKTETPKTDIKTFSGGSKVSPKSETVKDISTKSGSLSLAPKTNNVDKQGQRQQAELESKKTFQKSAKTEFKTPTGKTHKIDPRDETIKDLRNQVSHERFANRELRQREFYAPYYSRPVILYNDPYPSFFWWWLLDRSLDERALWAYHHRYDMDSTRYNDLLLKDSQLNARIRALEEKNTPRNKSYTPNGIDKDLMYSDEYVKAVVDSEDESDWSGFWSFCGWMLIAVLGGFVCWFVFIKKINQ